MKRLDGYEWMQTEEYKRKVLKAKGSTWGDVASIAICVMVLAVAFAAVSLDLIPHA